MVKTMKMNACKVMMRMWNTAQGKLSAGWTHHGSKAIKMKINLSLIHI